MRNVSPASLWSKRGGLIGCMLLLLGAAVVGATERPIDRAAWKAKYQRPTEIPFPEDNPYSESKFRLGQMLFFDPILSGSQSKSCASCHNPNLSWSDGLPKAIGDKQTTLPYRSPTLLNIAWTPRPGWSGHFRDLENVAFGPINSANNMNLSEAVAVERLSHIDGYVDAFQTAFGEGPITKRKIELALATFQRTIVSTEAPFDYWIKGNESAISEQAKRGFDLFNNKANCVACHSGWAFTDASFHDIGVERGDDIGRGKQFPNSPKLRYAFKTPTLRDAARRTPYMHDGSVATLEEVIDLYDRGGIDRPSRSELVFPLKLTKREKNDLIAFLRTLTGKQEPISVPPLPR